MIKRILIIFLILILLITPHYAYAGQWVNADISNSKVWVDTSHWENHPYQAWVDTSHYEWGSYNIWVPSGYWYSQYWQREYYNSLYYRDLLQGWNSCRYGVYYQARHGDDRREREWAQAIDRKYNTNNWRDYYTDLDWVSQYVYGPYNNGDGTYRYVYRDWKTSLIRRSDWLNPFNLQSESPGYRTITYGWTPVWIDTSHWETRWGWIWKSSGYWGWFDNWVWVTSGYWDEAHGQVSVSKSPTYVFTSFHNTEQGEPSHLDLNLSWNFNKEVTGIRVYHELVRYRNKGIITVDGIKESAIGIGTKNGRAAYRLEYPKPGSGESKLYIQFTFANKTGVRLWANVPVNGFDSTLKFKAAEPVWFKSLLDAENISF